MREKDANGTELNRRNFLGGCLAAGAGAMAWGGCTTVEGAGRSKESRRKSVKRQDAIDAWIDLMGAFPASYVPLDSRIEPLEAREGIEHYHVSFASEKGDRVTGYLLIPPVIQPRHPAAICLHGKTFGAGKCCTVGLSGKRPGDLPDSPQIGSAFGLELARWGYITLSIDLLCDGERVAEGCAPYDTSEFYRLYPRWSIVGKNVWDVSRSVDFLLTRPFVDPRRIACLGHSIGGTTALFATAFDNRIAATVCNAGFLSLARNTDYWAPLQGFSTESTEATPGYVLLPRLRSYIENPGKALEIDFDSLMELAAPRPLAILAGEEELARDHLVAKVASASAKYCQENAGDRLSLFSYPRGQGFPPVAKRFSFNWLDRWLNHCPALPTIWPDLAI